MKIADIYAYIYIYSHTNASVLMNAKSGISFNNVMNYKCHLKVTAKGLFRSFILNN